MYASDRGRCPDLMSPWRRRRDRELHPRVPGPCRRHLAVRATGGARIGRHHPATQATRHDHQRQLHGIYVQRHPGLGRRSRCGLALHRADQASAKRLQRSFNGRVRDEPLNETLFRSLPHARGVPEAWRRRGYNERRPHSKQGRLTPQAYADALTGQVGRFAALVGSCADRPLANPANAS